MHSRSNPGQSLPAARVGVAAAFLSAALWLLVCSLGRAEAHPLKGLTAGSPSARQPMNAAFTPTVSLYLPALTNALTAPYYPFKQYLPMAEDRATFALVCPATSTAQWGSMAPRERRIVGAAGSPDLNLDVRGWYRVQAPLAFSRYTYPNGEPPDNDYPLYLSHIVDGGGVGSFVSTYQVNDWDWTGCNCAVPRSGLPYPTTMLGLRTVPGQALRAPRRDRNVDPEGFIAMVMYADANQLALKYTWEDRVDTGYMVHLTSLCVDPNLVVLYNQLDAAGRQELPGVRRDSVVGTAIRTEVDVVVRDSGSFLDPRSWQDWWQDQPEPSWPAPLARPK